MSITIRVAKADDAKWMIPLMQQSAKDGHFGVSMLTESQCVGLIQAALLQNPLPMMKMRRGSISKQLIPVQIHVADYNGDTVSFLVTLLEEGEPATVELHLLATRKNHRQKGYARALIGHAIERCSQGVRIYGRCYKKSTHAIAMLKSMGFMPVIGTGNDDPIELERAS